MIMEYLRFSLYLSSLENALGHSTTKSISKKHKACFGEVFESSRKRQKISIAWDMGNRQTGRQNAMKKLNCQVCMEPDVPRCHFKGTLSESSKLEDLKSTNPGTIQDEHKGESQQHHWISRWKSEMISESTNCEMNGRPEGYEHIKDWGNSSLQFDDDSPRTLGATKQRSRKGVPCRRPRENLIKCKKERDELFEGKDTGMNGLLGEKSPNEEGYQHPIESTRFHYREGGTVLQPDKAIVKKIFLTKYNI